MKVKILLGIFLLLCFSITIAQELEDTIGEDSELHEVVLQTLPRGLADARQYNEREAASYVKALAVGMDDNEPSLIVGYVGFEYADWISQYTTDFTRWLCIVVMNMSEKSVKMRVKLEMFYDDGLSVFTKNWKKTIGAEQVVLYYTTLTKIDKVGLYTIRGKLYGAKGLGNTNEVVSHFYIYEY